MKLFFSFQRGTEWQLWPRSFLLSNTWRLSTCRERALPIFLSYYQAIQPPPPQHLFLLLLSTVHSPLEPKSRVSHSLLFPTRKKRRRKKKKKPVLLRRLPPPSLFCCIRAKRKINISSSSSLPLTIQCDRSPVLFGAFPLSLCVGKSNEKKKKTTSSLSHIMSEIPLTILRLDPKTSRSSPVRGD